MNNRNKAILWVIAVFLAGTFLGSTLTYFWVKPMHPWAGRSLPWRRATAHPPRSERIMKHLSDTLELDDQQREQLRQILGESRQRYQTLTHQSRVNFREAREATRKKIALILRPDQLEEFRRFLKRKDRHRPPPDIPQ